jgi:hypothetical protein
MTNHPNDILCVGVMNHLTGGTWEHWQCAANPFRGWYYLTDLDHVL